MPWTCPNVECGALVEHDSIQVCPTCQREKTAWTLGGATRTLKVQRKKTLECRRGRSLPTAPGALQPHAGVAWPLTKAASALPVEQARALMERGELPAPEDVLCVRLHPAAAKATTLSLTPLFDAQGSTDVELVFEVTPEDVVDRGYFAVHVVCVHGPGAAEVSFPLLSVLDVTDATPSGHAPMVRVASAKLKPVQVTLEGPTSPALATLRVRAYDEAYRPVAGAPYTLRDGAGTTREGTTDAEGWLEQQVEPGLFSLEVTRGSGPPLRFEVRADAAEGTDAWFHQQVRNLGFEGLSDREALFAFQVAHDLPRSGELDGPSRDALQAIARDQGASLQERLGKA